jgi:hypothetical protein
MRSPGRREFASNLKISEDKVPSRVEAEESFIEILKKARKPMLAAISSASAACYISCRNGFSAEC